MPDQIKKKILYVIPSLQSGGAEIQLLSLVRGLDKSEFAVTVAVFYQGSELDAAFVKTPNVQIVFLHKRHALDFSFLLRLKKLIKSEKFDIVQAYNISARFFAILYAKKFNVPLIIGTERTAKSLPTSLLSRIYLFVEKRMLSTCDWVITNSYAGRNYVESFGVSKSKVIVIENGIDAERLDISRQKEYIYHEFNIPSDAFLVGMSARIQDIKDPFTFVDVAALLKKEHLLYFMLIGDGPLLPQVRARAKTLGVESIVFTGHRRDVADLINALDVFLFTSRTIEGCSNALIEALVLGVPAVVTHIGGNSQIVQDGINGYLFQPGQAKQAAEHILYLKNDKKLYTTLAQNARTQAQLRFSQAAMVAAYQKVYKQNSH